MSRNDNPLRASQDRLLHPQAIARRTARHVVALVAAVVVFLLFFPSVGYPQVPKAEDIAACNLEAQHAIGKGAGGRDAALPNTKDQSRAAEARRADPTTQGVPRGTQSDDPQQQGMDTEGAKDPAYQAVYRTCMRRAGF